MTVQYSDTSDRDVTYKTLSDPFTEQEYSQIQYKIKLTAGDGAATTPKVIDFATLFETIQRD